MHVATTQPHSKDGSCSIKATCVAYVRLVTIAGLISTKAVRKEPETKERKFEDVVKAAEQAAVLVLVY